jgi:hypothetical protein
MSFFPPNAAHLFDGLAAALQHLPEQVGAIAESAVDFAATPQGQAVTTMVRGVMIGRGVPAADIDAAMLLIPAVVSIRAKMPTAGRLMPRS